MLQLSSPESSFLSDNLKNLIAHAESELHDATAEPMDYFVENLASVFSCDLQIGESSQLNPAELHGSFEDLKNEALSDDSSSISQNCRSKQNEENKDNDIACLKYETMQPEMHAADGEEEDFLPNRRIGINEAEKFKRPPIKKSSRLTTMGKANITSSYDQSTGSNTSEKRDSQRNFTETLNKNYQAQSICEHENVVKRSDDSSFKNIDRLSDNQSKRQVQKDVPKSKSRDVKFRSKDLSILKPTDQRSSSPPRSNDSFSQAKVFPKQKITTSTAFINEKETVRKEKRRSRVKLSPMLRGLRDNISPGPTTTTMKQTTQSLKQKGFQVNNRVGKRYPRSVTIPKTPRFHGKSATFTPNVAVPKRLTFAEETNLFLRTGFRDSITPTSFKDAKDFKPTVPVSPKFHGKSAIFTPDVTAPKRLTLAEETNLFLRTGFRGSIAPTSFKDAKDFKPTVPVSPKFHGKSAIFTPDVTAPKRLTLAEETNLFLRTGFRGSIAPTSFKDAKDFKPTVPVSPKFHGKSAIFTPDVTAPKRLTLAEETNLFLRTGFRDSITPTSFKDAKDFKPTVPVSPKFHGKSAIFTPDVTAPKRLTLAEETNLFLRTGFRDSIAPTSFKDAKDFKPTIPKTPPFQRRRLFNSKDLPKSRTLAELTQSFFNSGLRNNPPRKKKNYDLTTPLSPECLRRNRHSLNISTDGQLKKNSTLAEELSLQQNSFRNVKRAPSGPMKPTFPITPNIHNFDRRFSKDFFQGKAPPLPPCIQIIKDSSGAMPVESVETRPVLGMVDPWQD